MPRRILLKILSAHQDVFTSLRKNITFREPIPILLHYFFKETQYFICAALPILLNEIMPLVPLGIQLLVQPDLDITIRFKR
jgi:hypothetical protein